MPDLAAHVNFRCTKCSSPWTRPAGTRSGGRQGAVRHTAGPLPFQRIFHRGCAGRRAKRTPAWQHCWHLGLDRGPADGLRRRPERPLHAGLLQGSVAMQNAEPPVKAAADYVTEADNNHDGVAEAIESLSCTKRRRGHSKIMPRNLVLFDLEGTSATSRTPLTSRVPADLRGEIIEIGAVKIDEDANVLDTFDPSAAPHLSQIASYQGHRPDPGRSGQGRAHPPGSAPLYEVVQPGSQNLPVGSGRCSGTDSRICSCATSTRIASPPSGMTCSRSFAGSTPQGGRGHDPWWSPVWASRWSALP